jgi:phytoene dehydrogenase-like protein
VPGTRTSDYLDLAAIARLQDETVVADAMRHGRLYWRLVEPLAVAALNTRPQRALARLLGTVMRETLLRGGAACTPRFPREGLSQALVDPALALLWSRGATVHFNRRVTALGTAGSRAVVIATSEGTVPVGPGDQVVVATPPWIAAELLAPLMAPNEFEAIVNIHYRIDADPRGPTGEAGFIGVLEGIAEWVFVKRGHVSVTISAANALVDDPAPALAGAAWPDVCAALNIRYDPNRPLPPFRVVKERRATFAATAAQERRRPGAKTVLENLLLAGDWTATGLPATIEGAIRSGRTAATLLLAA